MGSVARSSIEAVASAHPDSTFFPESQSFEHISTSYWAQNVVLRPSCVFLPSSTEELSSGLQLISKNKINFAVRGGGHNTNKGWNNIDGEDFENGGILISTAALKSFELVELVEDGGQQMAKIGVGFPLLDIYERLDGKDIAIPLGKAREVV
jgi:FAD/FMN-containing dehydrogenase